MLVLEVAVVLGLVNVAAGIEVATERSWNRWSPLYWVQLAAAVGGAAYALFVVAANRELVEEGFPFLPPVVVLLVVLLPLLAVLVAYTGTFTLGYWSYRPEIEPSAREDQALA